jgi:hypothetical protein
MEINQRASESERYFQSWFHLCHIKQLRDFHVSYACNFSRENSLIFLVDISPTLPVSCRIFMFNKDRARLCPSSFIEDTL